MDKNMDQLAVNTLRVLSAEAVEKAKSGHPGLPMGAAPTAFTLWKRIMNHNPQNHAWKNRDRFVLSAGHGSMLLYSLLHVFGYGLTMDDIKQFRQFESKTPGHPEHKHTDAVEVTTGPLGQGFSNSVGLAIAEARLASQFNRPDFPVVDHFTYVLCSDGDMMEGVASEAASLAGTLKLGKLIAMYDSNSISIEGKTDLAFREDVKKRFEAYGWHVQKVTDGNDLEAIEKALHEAKAETGKPSFIEIITEIGYGSPSKKGTAAAHGEPLGEDNLREAREYLGWEEAPFTVPQDLRQLKEEAAEKGRRLEADWEKMLDDYFKAYPEMREEWHKWYDNTWRQDVLDDESMWQYDKPNATRSASGDIINRLAEKIPNLFGGSADLAPSTKTLMKKHKDFQPDNHGGSNMRFGVREHAMAAIANGIAVHGGFRTFAATFFIFTDYMRAGMRLSALMQLPVTYVLTHDSIGLGEDGPTHQPIEHLTALRSMPNMITFRPADGKETAMGWRTAITSESTPVSLILTRQNLPLFEETGSGALKGGYILKEIGDGEPELLLMASGSEVALVMEAADRLGEKGIAVRVISMPSWELFEQQPESYRHQVMPPNLRKRIAVEAGATLGWYKYTGLDGKIIGLDHFGASAPGEVIFEEFGLTPEAVVTAAEDLLAE